MDQQFAQATEATAQGTSNSLDAASPAHCDFAVRAREVRQYFDDQGISIADWAQKRGFSVALTRAILSGKRRCIRGQSHHIAIALGIKRVAANVDLDALYSNPPIRKETPMTT